MEVKKLKTIRHIKHIIMLLIILISQHSFGQTFTGIGGAIADYDTSYYAQTIASLPTDKLRPQYGLQSVELNIVHTYDQNLIIYLISPDGTMVNLLQNTGVGGDDFIACVFNDLAPVSIQVGTAPFTGVYKPNQPLGNINNYQPGNGLWQLVVIDDSPGDVGNVINWKLNFGGNVSGVTDTFNTDIPLVYINTTMLLPVPDSMQKGCIKIIDHNGTARNKAKDSIFQFLGEMGIKVHGNFSLNFPQRSYSIELHDNNNNDTSVAIGGMPAESDWLLLGTWNDRAFVRNPLMYKLYNSMGHYATRYKFCEVFLNGEYIGIYQLTEKIKRDKNRVDIAKLKDIDLAGDSLTGGYIFKHDYVIDTLGWKSDIAPAACPTNFAQYQYVYPNYENIKSEQAAYLRTFVDSVETRMFSPSFADPMLGYRPMIDVNSFADYLIANAVAWNGDGFSKSLYLYKDKDSKDGKLYAGPIWDFDWSLKKMPWINDSIDVVSYNAPPCNNFQATLPWFGIMMSDSFFANTVRCRYEYFRNNILSTAFLNASIDSIESTLDEAQTRHYTRWPTWGQSLGTPELHLSLTMQEELDTMKAMMARRLNWLDIHLPGVCSTPLSVDQTVQASALQIYPNPASTQLHIVSAEPLQQIILYNVQGQQLYRLQVNNQTNATLDLSHLTPGIYLLKTQSGSLWYMNKVIVQ